MLSSAQKLDGWGKSTLVRLSSDMRNLYPDIKGFSVRNLQCMAQFYCEYNKELTMIRQNTKPLVSQLQSNMKPPVSQLPKYNFELPIKHLSWSHNILLIQQVKDIRARYWYMTQCVVNHWSRRYLAETIKLDYYNKHGALANNFDTILPTVESDDVKSMLKDPYIFDMLTFTDQYNERDIEIGLTKHIEKFLVEMGQDLLSWGGSTISRCLATTIISTC